MIKNTEETILYSAFVLDPKLPEPGIWSDENRKELRTSFFGNFDRFTSDVYELFPEIDEVEQRNCLIERIVDISEQQFGKTKREVVEGIRDEAFKEARREYRIHHDYEDAEPHLAEYLRLAEQTGDDTTVKLQELAAIAFDEAKSQYNYNSIGAHYYGKAQPHLDQYVELSKQAGNDPKEKLQELVTIVLDEARKHCGLEGCTDEADPHLIQAQSLATTYELTEVSTQIQQLRN